jgi:hypothetical protein
MMGSMTLTTLAFAWVALNPGIHWHHDYQTAYRIAAEQKKPLVVFLGHGENGISKLINDGTIDGLDTKTLDQSYVSLYIDSDAAKGKALAQSFEMTEGVIISDRSGSLQAVRHEGAISKNELSQILTTYAQPNQPVITTEYRGRSRGPIMTYIVSPERPRPVMNTVQTIIGFSSGST